MRFQVAGAKGKISNVDEVLEEVKDFCSEKGCEAQLFDASMVFGEAHIQSAFEHAKRAFDEKRSSANSFATEVLLYASGERQISVAIKKMGIKDETTEFCILLIGDDDPDSLIQQLELKRDDSLLEGDVKDLKTFGISKKEMGTVTEDEVFDLVLERVAMVDLLK